MEEPHNFEDVSLKIRAEFRKVRNWVDLARAATGTVAIDYVCFAAEPEAGRSVGISILVIKFILLLVSVLAQTLRLKGRVRLVAPIFFILGLSVGLISWLPALFACVAVWTCNRVIPSAGVFLFVFAGFELGFGLLLARGKLDHLVLGGALAILPILLSAMIKQPLDQLNKTSRTMQA